MKSRKKSSPACGVVVFNPLKVLASAQQTNAQNEERTFVERYLALADAALGKGAHVAKKPPPPKAFPPKAA